MKEQCSFCYLNGEELKKCSKCHKRKFCSLKCQKEDWKYHKFFCCNIGEENYDWEIKTTKEKGLGVFALRDFNKFERLMFERVLFEKKALMDLLVFKQSLTKNDFPFFKSEENAFFSLSCDVYDDEEDSSIGKTLLQTLSIFQRNSFGNGIGDLNTQGFSFICINTAKINHSCLPNVFIWLSSEVSKTIVTSCHRDIKKGEEILISYCSDFLLKNERQDIFLEKFKFECNCKFCNNLESDKIFIEIIKLLDEIKMLSENIERDEDSSNFGIEKAKSIFKLFKDYDLVMTPSFYSQICNNCYKFGKDHKNLLKIASKYLKNSYEENLNYFGENYEDTLKDKKNYNLLLIQ
jgi:hypothetical protein